MRFQLVRGRRAYSLGSLLHVREEIVEGFALKRGSCRLVDLLRGPGARQSAASFPNGDDVELRGALAANAERLVEGAFGATGVVDGNQNAVSLSHDELRARDVP